ncbi:MAG: 3-hydroxyacyl-CoA dehydrogenase family protein, partial [Aeromicrobium sp.]
MSPIESVGIVGGGLMGSGIAEVSSRAGITVTLVEISTEAADQAQSRIEGSLRRAEKRGKIEAAEVEDVLARISFTDALEQLAQCDLVVEAASENEQVKLELFRRIGPMLEKEDAILASNTSSIP